VVGAAAKDLSKAGGNRWVPDAKAPLTETDSQIIQNHLEASNVQPVQALTEMIAVSRYYEAFQKTLQSSTELDQKLSSSVGKINS
jgi:flagellar basal-body rod protein FlgG